MLKKYLAHRWDTYEYADPKKYPLETMRDGIKDSFAMHYFGYKFTSGQLKLTKKSPLYIMMRPHCPRAAKVLEKETPDHA